MTYFTNPDGLPAPDDYQKPADSPSAFRALADATQAAVSSVRSFAQARIIQTWGDNTDVTISQAILTAWRTQVDARRVNTEPGSGLTGGDLLSNSPKLVVDLALIATRQFVTSITDGKADSGHTHPFPFRYGRPGQSFRIGADASTGNISIAHGLGRVPAGAVVSADSDGGNCSVFASVDSWDGTYLYAQMRNIGASEKHVFVNWIAW